MALFNKDYPDCTPERERQLLSQIMDEAKREAYVMRKNSDVPMNVARVEFERHRNEAISKLQELKRTCGKISLHGSVFNDERQAHDVLYKHYQTQFNQDVGGEGEDEPY